MSKAAQERRCATCRHWVRLGRVVGICRELHGSGELYEDECQNCVFWEPKDEAQEV